MQEMEVHDPHLTSPTPILSALRKRLDLRSKGRQRARKIRTKWVGSIGSVGSSHDSEAGIVTTNRQAPRPCKGAGTNSPPWPAAMPLLWLNKMRESRSVGGGWPPEAAWWGIMANEIARSLR